MLILAMLVLLAGCAAAPAAPAVQCRIVLESSPAFTAKTQTAAVTPGQTVTFTLTPADGYTLTGADYPGARLTRTGTGYTLSLPEVRYSTAVAVTAEKSDTVLYYRDNLGGDWIEAPVTASHLRVNTAIQGELFNNPGHTLTGWNTAPDGSGQAVGLGSRTEPGSRLYAQWAAQNDAAEFTFTVNNGTAPVYSGSYYATFADKYDRLLSLSKTRKLVLFSGSSARFGYDSAALDQALPSYAVVNMGVFAYTNALPQLELIRSQLQEGDLLLLSPEFDAAKRQFCTTNAFDDDFFCMVEENYDLLAPLDLRQYSGVFSALGSYLQTRAGMAARSYAVSPAELDEDGNPVDTPSYNAYGDYILYRPDAGEDTPIYGLPVDYTVDAFPQAYYIDPANAEIARFTADGVRVWLTYSPRNSQAVSEASTPEAIAALDAYFRENLNAAILTPLQDSLLPGRYFYGTDNHLSTNGVALRTAQVITALKDALQKEGLTP